MPTITLTNAALSGSFLEGKFSGDAAQETEFPGQPEPPEPTEPPPTGEDWEPPAYLRTDTRAETASNDPRPGYLQTYTDPMFSTKIIRVTGDPGTPIGATGGRWGDINRHHYNSDQAWNADQTLLYLEDPMVILDGSSYEPLFIPKGRPSDADVRWWAQDPRVMIYAAGSKLGLWDLKAGDTRLIKDFGSSYSGCKFGPWEGSPTEDGNKVVISATKNGKPVAFAYDIAADVKHPDIDRGSYDNVRISPLGYYVVWCSGNDHVTVTDLEGNIVTDLADNMVSHFDVTVGPDGEEYIVGRVNSGSVGMGKGGRLARYRMKDGVGMGLNTGGWCSHTSTRSTTRRWAVSAPTDEDGGNPPYDGELIMSALDGSATYRLGHTHEPSQVDYYAQTQPSHSPDGGRVIFASAWGGSGSEPRPVHCYVVDFRT